MRADEGEVGHPHLLVRPFLDDRHPRQAIGVGGVAISDLAQEPGIDLVDDLEVARQQALEQPDRPSLQRLGEDGVVGVAAGAAGLLPGLIPLHEVLVDHDPHQLGDGDRGVGVVELDRDPVAEGVEVAVGEHVAADDVLYRAGGEKILLLEAELLPLRRVVLRVEHLGDVLGQVLLLDGADVVAGVEHLEVELVGGAGAPQPHRRHRVVAVAHDGRVVGDAEHALAIDPADAESALPVGHHGGMAAELDGERELGAGDLPGIAEPEPLVGSLDLLAVADHLVEAAELVADAVPEGGEADGGHGVEEAGGEAPQAAVAEAGVDLDLEHLLEPDVEPGQRLLHALVDAEVEQAVGEQASDQELGREVIHALGIGGVLRLHRLDPAGKQPVANGVGEGEEVVMRRRHRHRLALERDQVVEKGAPEPFDLVGGAVVLVADGGFGHGSES